MAERPVAHARDELPLPPARSQEQHREDAAHERVDHDPEEAEDPGERARAGEHHPLGDQEDQDHRDQREQELTARSAPRESLADALAGQAEERQRELDQAQAHAEDDEDGSQHSHMGPTSAARGTSTVLD